MTLTQGTRVIVRRGARDAGDSRPVPGEPAGRVYGWQGPWVLVELDAADAGDGDRHFALLVTDVRLAPRVGHRGAW